MTNKPTRTITAADDHGDENHVSKWRTQKNHFVPAANVAQYDKIKEAMLIPLLQEAARLSAELVDFKRRAFMAWRDFEIDALADYGVEINTTKGNGTLYTYNQQYKIQLCSSAVLEFDNRLQAASALISECLADWGKGADPNLGAVISEAFEADTKGMINVRKILSLRRLQINDERWTQAMQAIADATLEVTRSAYLNFYERVEQDGKLQWQLIPLSLAGA